LGVVHGFRSGRSVQSTSIALEIPSVLVRQERTETILSDVWQEDIEALVRNHRH